MSLGLRGRITLITSGMVLIALLAIVALSASLFAREVFSSLQSRSVAVGTSIRFRLEWLLHLGVPLDSIIGFERECQDAVRSYDGIEQAMVVAPDGTVLFHSQPSRKGERLGSPELRAAIRAWQTQAVAYQGADGRDAHAVAVPVLDEHGTHVASVVVVVPSSVITGKALRMAVTNLSLGLILLALGATALAAILSARVTDPLAQLLGAVQQLRRGSGLSRQVPLPAQGDLRQLADTFNGLLRDLQQTTVSKEALEDALRELARTEERFRRMVESSPSAILVQRAGELLFANAACTRLLGLEQESELRPGPLLEFVHPDSRALLEEHLSSLDGGVEVFRARDVKLVRRDGVVLQVELTGIRTQYDGHPAVHLVVEDVTEYRAMQAQLVAAGRLAAVGTMARGVAHEINNPLAYVLSGLEYVAAELQELGRHLPQERLTDLLAALTDARRGANQVRFIVSDLQAYSRDRDRLEPVQLERVLDLAASMAAPHLLSRARLVRDYGELPQVQGNEARLGQVFLNLVVNAAQAIPEGHPEENEIRISARVEGGRAVVEIHDTGCGIPPQIGERVFDPFFTTKQAGEGTGLGLFITHGIVKGMGGQIRFESKPGQGTTFVVTLPLASRADDALPPGRGGLHAGGASTAKGWA